MIRKGQARQARGQNAENIRTETADPGTFMSCKRCIDESSEDPSLHDSGNARATKATRRKETTDARSHWPSSSVTPSHLHCSASHRREFTMSHQYAILPSQLFSLIFHSSHAPEHAHFHSHTHSDILNANRTHFDNLAHAGTYANSFVKQVIDDIGAALLEAYPFSEESTTVMDFACGKHGRGAGIKALLASPHSHIPPSVDPIGPGLVSQLLAPHAKKIVGIDISQGMVDAYNTSVHNQGIDPAEMNAVCVDLKGQDSELDGLKFDVVVVRLYILLQTAQ